MIRVSMARILNYRYAEEKKKEVTMKTLSRIREKFERTMVAIAFAEHGLHEYAIELMKKDKKKRPEKIIRQRKENRLEM